MSSSDAAGEEGEVACGMRKLSDLCLPTETVDPRKSPQKEFCYVDISSVDNRTKRIVGFQTLLGSKAPSRARNLISAGDIILSTTRPNLNAVAMVPPELDGQVCSTGFCVLRAGQHLDRDFLFLCLQRKEFIDALVDLVKGALYPAVSDRQVFAQSIPLPDLPTQRRIAARLKEQMAEVEAARKAVEEQQKASKAIFLKILREHISSSCGEFLKVGEIADVVSGVGFPESFQGRQDLSIPFIKVSDMNAKGNETTVWRAANSVSPENAISLGAKICPKETIILPKVGGALLTNKRRLIGVPSAFDNNILGIIPDLRRVRSRWLFYWTLALDLRPLANTQALPSIKGSVIKNIELRLPSIKDQDQMIDRLDIAFDQTESLRAGLGQQMEAVSALPAAYLRAAFEGIE
jgi:type I restriction enzyme S subunit